MTSTTDPNDGVQHGQNAVEGQGIDDPGTTSATPKPLSPEEYAEAKKEIEAEGDKNESGHKNG